LPLSSELRCNFFYESCELIELLLGVIAIEKIKVGVVVDLAFLRPQKVLGGF